MRTPSAPSLDGRRLLPACDGARTHAALTCLEPAAVAHRALVACPDQILTDREETRRVAEPALQIPRAPASLAGLSAGDRFFDLCIGVGGGIKQR